MRDYRETLLLPKTSFPMRASLPRLEREVLRSWEAENLYESILKESKGRSLFLLHDGPPYANGPVHMGAALNKTLKDVAQKAKFMEGYGVHYVPGWDCHGLPIEWKVEQNLLEDGTRKESLSAVEFRLACRRFAAINVKRQKATFKRLGILGDWKHAYLTMDFKTEAALVEEVWRLARKGYLYKGVRPVFWSSAEETALADAEVEYYERKSPAIYVGFPVTSTDEESFCGARFVVWTTTPWTLVANRALAVGESFPYVVFRVERGTEVLKSGERIILGAPQLEHCTGELGITGRVESHLEAKNLLHLRAFHPLRGCGYDRAVPVLLGEFVDAKTGTGVVHVAPGHGVDDFLLGRAHGLPLSQALDSKGYFAPWVPKFAGQAIFDSATWDIGEGQRAVLRALKEAGQLLAKRGIRHAYPHSWRSKAPLVYRAVPQWFFGVDRHNLRERALRALDSVQFEPPGSKRRLQSMLQNRGDWCISRQRLWGVPLAFFVHKDTGDLLLDDDVFQRIVAAIRQHGADVWYATPKAVFLGERQPDLFEPVMDIMDVWLESGSTHRVVVDRLFPGHTSDLVLEGSDQHRGWFQSSLLEAVAAHDKLPARCILTHGFVLDSEGRKMSKSLGNVLDPEDICKTDGAEIVRIWAVTSLYTEDVRVGEEVVAGCRDLYRKVRNVLRWLLGTLRDEAPALPPKDTLPLLERYVLSRLAELSEVVRGAYGEMHFSLAWRRLFSFFNETLSSLYFDARKDLLYCEPETSQDRRACLWVMDRIFEVSVLLLAPILSFTAEEAYRKRYPGRRSVHLGQFVSIPSSWRDQKLEARFEEILKVRKAVLGSIEIVRKRGEVGSSLEAAPVIHGGSNLQALLEGAELAALCGTSDVIISSETAGKEGREVPDLPGVSVVFKKARGKKSARSWKVTEDVGQDPTYPDLSLRDARIVRAWDAKA